MHLASVLLVEDHPIFRDGLRRILETQEDLKVVGHADTVAGAMDQARALQPDVTLLDLGLKDGDGLSALPGILMESPRSRVIVLTGRGAENAAPALGLGARGFVSKDTASERLLKAVRAVLGGEIWADPSAVVSRGSEAAVPEPPVEESLTPREQEVLRLVGEGRRNNEIAHMLCISENTVKTHVSSLMRKLEMEDRIQLTLHGARAAGSVL